VLLAPTRLDLLVPFLPWTVWVYLGQFPLTFLALWRAADDRTRTRTFYAMAAATLLAAAVFLGWPTTGERPRLRPPGPSALALEALDRVDVPNNWFPSLHVALAALAATGLAAHGRRAGAAAGAAAALVAASTLTTKQHLAVDGAGGLAVAAVAYWLAGRVRPP
jgi:membrane-associated phospholipid phosphatase